MDHRVLITGHSGLIGNRLRSELKACGIDVCLLDLRGSGRDAGDVRRVADVRRAITGCDGVVHLAAVSRVVWAERDPEQCWSTNVGGLGNVIDAIEAQAARPWLVFASSREVYGQPDTLPVPETAPLRPMNVYGRAKVQGEQMIEQARRRGLQACTVRLSNVYGSVADHVDRVIPAFARAAVQGLPLRIDGSEHSFDFTHVDDVAAGLAQLCDQLRRGNDAPPPIHLLTGQPTTLGQLADLAIGLTGGTSTRVVAPPRGFDVARFHGDPSRALKLLDWSARVPVHRGLEWLIGDFRRELTPGLAAELPS